MNASPRIASLNRTPLLVTALLASFAAGCDRQAPETAAPAATMASEPVTSSSRDFGEYVLHFNAIRTDSLTPEVATAYGIVRSTNRALVNISIVKKADGTPGNPVPGKVTVDAVNLNAQLKDLTLREVREGNAIYYIGDVAIAGQETLVFTVNATPEGTNTPLSLRFQREFVGE